MSLRKRLLVVVFVVLSFWRKWFLWSRTDRPATGSLHEHWDARYGRAQVVGTPAQLIMVCLRTGMFIRNDGSERKSPPKRSSPDGTILMTDYSAQLYAGGAIMRDQALHDSIDVVRCDRETDGGPRANTGIAPAQQPVRDSEYGIDHWQDPGFRFNGYLSWPDELIQNGGFIMGGCIYSSSQITTEYADCAPQTPAHLRLFQVSFKQFYIYAKCH